MGGFDNGLYNHNILFCSYQWRSEGFDSALKRAETKVSTVFIFVHHVCRLQKHSPISWFKLKIRYGSMGWNSATTSPFLICCSRMTASSLQELQWRIVHTLKPFLIATQWPRDISSIFTNRRCFSAAVWKMIKFQLSKIYSSSMQSPSTRSN